jgi:exopolysaccharide production protein ExoQ
LVQRGTASYPARQWPFAGRRGQTAAGYPDPDQRTSHPALFLIKAFVFMVAVVTSVGTFNEYFVPPTSNIQQYISITMWASIIYASAFPPRVLRLAPWNDTIVAVMFFGFAIASIAWSNYSSDSVLKGLALVITTVGAYRVAVTLTIDDIVDCVVAGLFALIAASLILVGFFPQIGVNHTWMQDGLWQGVFASKQSLGAASAFLMFFASCRVAARGGKMQFLVVFVAAAACVIGSGSRGGGILALAAIASLFLSMKSQGFAKVLAFTPLVLLAVAYLLMGYLFVTGVSYIPLFDTHIDLTERTLIWQYALRHFHGEAVFIGFGVNGFWSNQDLYYAFLREHGWVLDNFHNGYLAILMETGLIGTALFTLMYFLSCWKLLWLGSNGLISRAHYSVIVCFVNLHFIINFTETFFLRSTNCNSVLLVVFLFICCQAPQPGAAWRESPEPRRQLKQA